MHGCTPALSSPASPTAMAGVAPEPPAQNPLQRTAIVARVTSTGRRSPTDMARPRSVCSEKAAAAWPSTRSTTRDPSPVVRP
jgi:hypothetical protein